jgi:hypothetical protein
MSDERDDKSALPENDWARLWQEHSASSVDAERMARAIMAHTWRFDQELFWRNFREYAAGIVVMAVFAGQIALGEDRVGGVIGLACVGFVMAYLWWRHRGLRPLDPAADVTAYRESLLHRFDDQIALLRATPYWYLLPLFVPGLWQAIAAWPRVGWAALAPLAAMVVIYVFLGWLNVRVAVRGLMATRERMAAMFAEPS